jgi:hypothetical protein
MFSNSLKKHLIFWQLPGFLLVSFLIAASIASAGAASSFWVRISDPKNGFHINRYNFDAFSISGNAESGNDVEIYANGILLGTTPTDADGRFASDLDFSEIDQGRISITAVQKHFQSAAVSGTYDATAPQITDSQLGSNTITLTFNASKLQNATQEENYRFSPSLNFNSHGAADDITQIDDHAYQLALRSIPQHEIISLALSDISDAAGNAVDPALIRLNDSDHDRMADDWEALNGLNPMVADALQDDDADGFSNFREYLARSNPLDVFSAPIEIRDSIPRDDAGIANAAQVADETSFAVLIRAVHGINVNVPDAIRLTVADGFHQPYVRDLGSEAVRVIKLNDDPDEQVTYLWVVYDRFLEPYMPESYPLAALIDIKVEVRDAENNILQPAAFEFRIESASQKAARHINLPQTAEVGSTENEMRPGYDAGIRIIAGELGGAKVIYSSWEPRTPQFGSLDGIEAVNLAGAEALGPPVNLAPHTVFDKPIKLFVPLPQDADIGSAGLAYFDGIQWLPAVDAEGHMMSGGEGWLVPGSRVNHADLSPALIEVQVYHFSGTQAVIFAADDEPKDEGTRLRSNGSNVIIFANCFITSATADSEFGFWFVAMILMLALLISFSRICICLLVKLKKEKAVHF